MRLDRNIRLLAWFNFFLELKFYNAILVIYFAQVTGSYALAMGIFAAVSFSAAFFELPTGIFSDLIGRKRTLVMGALAHAGSVVLYALGGSYTVFLLGGICEGLGWALFSGNNAALLHDTLAETGQEAAYQEYLGRTTAMEHVGVALVAIVGAALASLTSFAVVMWLSVVPQVILVGIALRFREPRTHTRRTGSPLAHLFDALRVIRGNARLSWLGAAAVLSYGVGEAVYQLRVAFIERLWPLWALGVARMLDNIMAAASYYFSGRLIRRFSEHGVLIGGGIMGRAVTMLAYGLSSVLSPMLLSATSVLHGVQLVAQDGLMQREFTTEQRATLGSVVSLGASVAFGVVSVLIGLLADRLGLVTILLLAQVVQLIPLWMQWRGLRASGKHSAAQTNLTPVSH